MELSANHGGMGGEHTGSFLLHPADTDVPPTRRSFVGVALLSVFAAWLGVAEAHRLRGLRTLALPVLIAAILLAPGWAQLTLVSAGEFTVGVLATRLGLTP